eukprot:32216_1
MATYATVSAVHNHAMTNCYQGRTAIALNWKTISWIVSHWLRSITKDMDPFDQWSDLNDHDDPFSVHEPNESNPQKRNDMNQLLFENISTIVFKIIAKYIRINDNDDFFVTMHSNSQLQDVTDEGSSTNYITSKPRLLRHPPT